MLLFNILNVLLNWAVLLTAPFWIVPFLIYMLFHDGLFIKTFIKGQLLFIDRL